MKRYPWTGIPTEVGASLIRSVSVKEVFQVSLISRLRAVVAGDDYLDGDLDDFAYDDDQAEPMHQASRPEGGALATLGDSNPFDLSDELGSSNVIGMPGISTAAAEVNLMEPRSFDEMPQAIQALRERKTVILNLTMMEPDQAQRAVDFVAGGTFAIDGHPVQLARTILLTLRRRKPVDASQVTGHLSIRHLVTVVIPGVVLVGLDGNLLTEHLL